MITENTDAADYTERFCLLGSTFEVDSNWPSRYIRA